MVRIITILFLLLIFFAFNDSSKAQMPFEASFEDDIFENESAYDDAYSPNNKNEGATQKFVFPTASLTASAEKKTVPAGQPFKITISLKNADALSPPDTSVFPEGLKILTRSQQSNVSIINGRQSKSTNWVFEVSAVNPGSYSIPPISIQSDNGSLYSKAFNVYIKDATDIPAKTDDNSVFIEAKIEKQTPFVGEPIEYVVKLYHLMPIEKAELVKPESDGAKIEQIKEPVKYQKELNGQNYNVLEVTYLVTPQNSGKVKLSPAILRGKTLKEVKKERPRTAFDNFFDPFAVIDSAFSVTREVESFSVASNQIVLDVKPSLESVSPWLALYDLEIEDELYNLKVTSGNTIETKVGEPISRKLVVTAIGAKGVDIPDIEDYIDAANFKVYADKPQNEQKILTQVKGPIAKKIKGIKTQSFTFIPEKEGNLIIPEIRIPYYSIPFKEVKYAILPSQSLNVQPSNKSNFNNFSKDKSQNTEENSKNNSFKQTSSENKISLFNILLSTILTVLIFYFIFIILRLKNKVSSKIDRPVKKIEDIAVITKKTSPKKKNQGGFKISSEIDAAKKIKELEKAIKNFGFEELSISKNVSVTVIAQQVARKFNINKNDLVRVCSELDASIYADKKVNFKDLKERLLNIFSKIEERKNFKSSKIDQKKLNPLNPS